MQNHWKKWEATGEATGRPLGRPLGGHWEATVHISHSAHGFITLQTDRHAGKNCYSGRGIEEPEPLNGFGKNVLGKCGADCLTQNKRSR